MNLKIAVGFIIYYILMSLVFNFGVAYLGDAYMALTTPPDTNYSLAIGGNVSVVVDPTDFGVTQSIIETCGFIFFGIGLPSDTPLWFQIMFSMIMSGVSLLGLLFMFDAIHTG